jgi:glutamine synthetase
VAPPAADPPHLTVEELRRGAAEGRFDTVIVALPDMEGRLQGKRYTATTFLSDVLAHGVAEGCEYLLASDVDMNPVEGYGLAGWDRGFADFEIRPDLATLRPVPWAPGTALVLADAARADGADVAVAPRAILRRQLARLAERGLQARASTELEFLIFRTTYRDAWRAGYRDLEPATRYNVDYSIQGTAALEPLIRRIRSEMAAAGMTVENSKGECNLGQHEVNFRYGDALRIADDHVVYKSGAKEIAEQEGVAITFMAKYDEREGNSCHVHLSLAREGAANAFAEDPALFHRFLAGQLACLREMTLLFAPQVNSYKRFVPNSFAPTAVAWGRDNRTCALRVVGHGPGLRLENRLPGGDVNPYLALAAMIASGLHGLDAELELEPAFEGNAYVADKPRVPHTMAEARALLAGSAVAREAFGDEVVEHYLNRARIELEAFAAAVTDWERMRGFERL